MDLPLQQSLAGAGDDDDELELATARAKPSATRWPRWPRRPAIPIRSGGGTTSSSTAATARRRSTSVAEAMTAVRGGRDASTLREAQREAHMRQVLRRAIADGHERIAVVCGAWHVPALAAAAATGDGRRRARCAACRR